MATDPKPTVMKTMTVPNAKASGVALDKDNKNVLLPMAVGVQDKLYEVSPGLADKMGKGVEKTNDTSNTYTSPSLKMGGKSDT